jgi:hypothetical protein
MTDVDDIREILGADPYQGAPVDWEAASSALGVPIPADYRALVDTLGPGLIGRDLVLPQPFAGNRNFDLIASHQERMDGLEKVWESEAQGPPVFRTKPAVFDRPGVTPVLWALSGNGNYLYWIADPSANPSTWDTAVDSARGEEWEFFSGPATSVLLRLLRGEAETDYLSALARSAEHSFTPAT